MPPQGFFTSSLRMKEIRRRICIPQVHPMTVRTTSLESCTTLVQKGAQSLHTFDGLNSSEPLMNLVIWRGNKTCIASHKEARSRGPHEANSHHWFHHPSMEWGGGGGSGSKKRLQPILSGALDCWTMPFCVRGSMS